MSNDFFGDNLQQQIVNISKASAYDIVSKQVQELQAENEALKERVKVLEDALQKIITINSAPSIDELISKLKLVAYTALNIKPIK